MFPPVLLNAVHVCINENGYIFQNVNIVSLARVDRRADALRVRTGITPTMHWTLTVVYLLHARVGWLLLFSL